MSFTIRTYMRFPVQCSMYYLSDHFVGEGQVWNLSSNGWRVDGSHEVTTGTILSLCVYLPGQRVPLTVEQAKVRWSRGHEFGLETVYMRPQEHQRFGRFVKALPRHPTP